MTSVPGYDPDAPAPFASPSAWRRFAIKAAATADHTIWLGGLADDGYGRFYDTKYRDAGPPTDSGSHIVRTHRWIWWAHHGPIQAQQNVLHLCDLPICVRLEHLSVGTQAENLQMASMLRLEKIAGRRSC